MIGASQRSVKVSALPPSQINILYLLTTAFLFRVRSDRQNSAVALSKIALGHLILHDDRLIFRFPESQ